MSGSFRIVGNTSSGILYGPDGRQYTEKWWDTPHSPDQHSSSAAVASLLRQVSQDGPDGRQSCALTCQLNALIVRGTLSPSTAADLQDRLTTDEAYARYWLPLGESGYTGWTADPHTLPLILYQSGVRVGVEFLDSPDVIDDLTSRLPPRLHAQLARGYYR